MIFGFILFVIGYAVFYWGIQHFDTGVTNGQRYSLWSLLGFGTLFKNINFPPGIPLQWNAPQQVTGGAGQAQQSAGVAASQANNAVAAGRRLQSQVAAAKQTSTTTTSISHPGATQAE